MSEVIFNTEDLSKMFRVGKSTIKRWTDEGKLQCFKTPGGHRKFKPANVHEFISQYHYEITLPHPSFEKHTPNNSSVQIVTNSQSSVETCFVNAIKGKHGMIERQFSQLFSEGKSVPAIFDDVLTPILRRIHSEHQNKKITSIEFQIAKNTLIHSLIHFADLAPKSEKKDVEIYCLSVNEGMNEVELKAVELLLENIGITVYNLGTVLTKYAAEDIVHQCKPEDVFVVLSLDHTNDEIIQQFNALVSGVQSYGGNVYTSNFFDEQRSNGAIPADSRQIYTFSEIVERQSEFEKSTVIKSI